MHFRSYILGLGGFNGFLDPQLYLVAHKVLLVCEGVLRVLGFWANPAHALLEQQIYDGVTQGTIRGADDLDRVSLQVDEQFSIFPTTTPELRNRWAAVSLMYEDPLYDVNYVYGGLLALKYFQLYSANREQFVPRYIASLKNGFDAPPAVLLKQFLNIDLLDGSLLSDDLALLNRRLDQLEASASH